MRLLSKNDPGYDRAFRVEGLPQDLAGAVELYNKDPLHKAFEMWAVGLVPAIPQEKKGADGGIDGYVLIHDDPKGPNKAIVQVKGGHVGAPQIQQLVGAMHKEKAVLGFFVCLETPTKPMLAEALSAGYYKPKSGVGKQVPTVQIRTIEQLLNGQGFDLPLFGSNVSYKAAEKLAAPDAQSGLDL